MSMAVKDPLLVVEELVAITTELSVERDLCALLSKILTSARTLTRSEAGRIYLLDPTKRKLVPEVSQNDRVTASLRSVPPIALYKNDKLNKSDLCAYAASTGRPVAVTNIYHFSGFDCSDIFAYDKANAYQTRSLLTVPMRDHQDITLGVLQLINPIAVESHALLSYDEDAQRLVVALASQAAVAVDNAWLIRDKQTLIDSLSNDRKHLQEENLHLKNQIAKAFHYDEIIGDSPQMRKLFSLLDKVTRTSATVLILGETGTGKELVARAIHNHSPRAKGPFVTQNCAAVPENLLESELFGYRRGAFTGANSDRMGLIEAANGGTLFLDEIGDMPLELQAKILRVLQEGEIRALGDHQSRSVDVRVVAATHRDLKELIKSGEFREDLYYRLAIFPIAVPPLRERGADLVSLLNFFLDHFSRLYDKGLKGYSPAALDKLLTYNYPGNVRELMNMVERAVIIADASGYVEEDNLGQVDNATSPTEKETSGSTLTLSERVRVYEAGVIQRQLEAEDWNQTRTAKALGVPRRTLVEKISRFNITRGAGESATQ